MEIKRVVLNLHLVHNFIKKKKCQFTTAHMASRAVHMD
jgi:hypothetical protein